MTATETTTEFAGYLSGTWVIDPTHSEVAFSIRHLMLSKVRGRFGTFQGALVTADDPLASSVEATVDLSSVDTGNPDRDAHLRSSDFFDVDQHPTLTYRSTGIRRDGRDRPNRLRCLVRHAARKRRRRARAQGPDPARGRGDPPGLRRVRFPKVTAGGRSIPHERPSAVAARSEAANLGCALDGSGHALVALRPDRPRRDRDRRHSWHRTRGR